MVLFQGRAGGKESTLIFVAKTCIGRGQTVLIHVRTDDDAIRMREQFTEAERSRLTFSVGV